MPLPLRAGDRDVGEDLVLLRAGLGGVGGVDEFTAELYGVPDWPIGTRLGASRLPVGAERFS